jgi:DNA-binding response OmpR family regulator
MRTLLVEDDDGLRGLLEDVLEARGHDVVAVGDGEQAWAVWQREGFSLAIVDWGLPRLDGLALCRRARQAPTGQRTLVVVMTGRANTGDLATILDAGADDYLAKPFDVESFGVRIGVAERRIANRHERERLDQERRAALAREHEAREGAEHAALAALAMIEATEIVAASAGRDIDATLDALALQARALLRADDVSVHLTDENGVELIRMRPSALARAGTPEATPKTRFAPDDVLSEAFAFGRPLPIDDFQHHPRVDPEAQASLPSLVCSIAVPLVTDDGPLGLILIQWARDHTITTRDLAAAETLGRHATIAIRTARLLDETQRARAELESMMGVLQQQARLDGAIKTARLVAHELNNALSCIGVYGHLLTQDVQGESAEFAEEMMRGAEDAAKIVRRLQRLMRFEETEVGGLPMLDLSAATEPAETGPANG